MAFDPAPSADELLLFSGYESDNFSDTQFWDGSNWVFPSTQIHCGSTPGEFCSPGDTGGASVATGCCAVTAPRQTRWRCYLRVPARH